MSQQTPGCVAGRPAALRPQRQGAVPRASDDPGEGYVQVNIGSAIGRHSPSHLALDQPEAVEGTHVVTEYSRGEPFGNVGKPISQRTVGRRIGGPRVNESSSVIEHLVEHPTNVARVLLAILVQRNQPRRDRTRPS